jgi:hypothetical protein
MTDVQEQLRYALKYLPNATAVTQPDGIIALRWDAVLPESWTPEQATLIVLVPPLFPAQAPSGFDAVGAVRLNGAAVGGAGARPIGQDACTHFCWNPAGTIDYAAHDGLWRFAKFSETRFLTRQ